MVSSRARQVWGVLLITFALTSCSPVIKPTLVAAISKGSEATLKAGQSIGQTLVAREGGLNGVEVFLNPAGRSTAAIQLHLRSEPQSSTDLAVAAVPAQALAAPGMYRFSFSPQNNSLGQRYYFLLDLQGEGELGVGTSAADGYLDGSLYKDGNPVDAQANFRLLYDPVQLLFGRFAQAAGWLFILGVGAFLFILPGLALLVLLYPGQDNLNWPEKLGLASGASLAIYPLLILWTNVIQLHLGPLYAWLPGLSAVILLAWHNRAWRPARFSPSFLRQASGPLWPDLTLVFIVGLVFFVRFWAIRSLDAPMWGDSYDHAMIAQLLVDNGGLFDSWRPYADLQSFTYHFGFHSAVAALHWVTNMAVPQATLVAGQILNGLAVLALYPLAVRIGRNRWAGVAAVLLAGLLAPMPMYYTNWGRYTQLAGQAILPGAILIMWEGLESERRDWRLLGLSWIIMGGLALTHYRILILAVLFVPAWILLQIRPGRVLAPIIRSAWLGLGGALLFLPWLIHIFAGQLLSTLAKQLAIQWTAPPAVTSIWSEGNSFGDPLQYLPRLLWLLLPLCVGWALWRRERGVLLTSLWWSLVLLATNPQWLRLPGEAVITNFTVLIAAYVPVGILVGAAVGWLIAERRTLQGRWQVVPVLLFLGLGVWGSGERLGDLNTAEHAMVTRPDIEAAAWIERNIPSEGQFLVNSFSAFGNTLAVGSDAGWWLPLLAHRQISVPPLNYGSEQGPRPDYWAWVLNLTTQVGAKGVDDPMVQDLLQEHGIGYVYIGQRRGKVNYSGPTLDPAQLQSSPYFRPLYHQDQVWVFEVLKR